MEKTEEQYDADYKYIKERFPNAGFDIGIDRDKLTDLLTTDKQIIIKQDFFCRCYGCEDIDHRPPNKYFIINNDVMSYENVIDELIKQNCVTDCDHNFLELIVKKTDVQYELWFGS
tara:strand:- start:374 stop:721 length:348 start_codon:yes stop_codon:yes gene_type:complete